MLNTILIINTINNLNLNNLCFHSLVLLLGIKAFRHTSSILQSCSQTLCSDQAEPKRAGTHCSIPHTRTWQIPNQNTQRSYQDEQSWQQEKHGMMLGKLDVFIGEDHRGKERKECFPLTCSYQSQWSLCQFTPYPSSTLPSPPSLPETPSHHNSNDKISISNQHTCKSNGLSVDLQFKLQEFMPMHRAATGMAEGHGAIS